MCDFTSVRNLLVAIGSLLTLAVSSAIFAFTMSQGKAPWTAIAAEISFSATAVWCTAGVIAVLALNNAVNTYCDCAKGVGTCSRVCKDFGFVIWTIFGAFLGLGVVSLMFATGAADFLINLILWGFIVGATAAGINLVIASINLGACQTQG